MQLVESDSFAGYTIQGVLGTGGMGTVYLARHPRLPRLIALKLLHTHISADPDLRRRFEQESEIAARLDHPGIVSVYDCGEHDDLLWIAMQYIHGSDASKLAGNAVTPERAVRIISETAAALDYAHSRDILHRDIKPANILLSEAEPGRAERAILTDFGIARLLTATTAVTSTGTFTATLDYASPEQLLGESVDARTDQYSLACTLFALLSGVAPFHALSPGQVVAGHIGRPPPRLSELRPEIPGPLDEVVLRAMSKDRGERFSSCTEFAAAARAAVRPGSTGTGVSGVAALTTALTSAPEPTTPATISRRTAPPAPARAQTPLKWAAPRTDTAVPRVPRGTSTRTSRTETTPPQRNRKPLVAAAVAAVIATGGAVLAVDALSGGDGGPSDGAGVVQAATIPVGNGSDGDIAIDAQAQRAYVVNSVDNTVTVIDTSTNTVATTVPVGEYPRGVAVDPATRTAFVLNSVAPVGNRSTVSVLDLTTNTVTATIPTGKNSIGIAVDSSTHAVFVVDKNDSTTTELTGSLTIIDPSAKAVTGTIPLSTGAEEVISLALDSKTHIAYVTTRNERAVKVVDTLTRTVKTVIPLQASGITLDRIAVDPERRVLYITDGTVITVVDTVSNVITDTIELDISSSRMDQAQRNVVIDPDTGTAYTVGPFTGVQVVDTGSRTVTGAVAVPTAKGIAVDPRTHDVYVNGGSGFVSVLDR
ncbi:protein kinase [Nocardia sp. 2]|uniref:non-specific serine/threonine protein kinase n=1 Tax=Nocardia acididurans TaxID=2802282 RepID=A0ABS1MFE3_9NOCA|nr:serine/threonine-protein kinase [Nocardia acididurans]MBL1078805.1 protein kinase [Nocardia acididurans]